MQKPKPSRPEMVHYDPRFVSPESREQILQWLGTIHPIWERRFPAHRPPPFGEEQRWLLRPVYWLGNWQFACLDYYRPPKGTQNRCVRAESFPPVMQAWVKEIEKMARARYRGSDLPLNWRLNTCLINFYGSRIEDNGREVDTARVGEHKDFEPGPVASISLGERALFQFVSSQSRGSRDRVVLQQWLEDSSLQLFGGRRWKQDLFHRVQRVESRGIYSFSLNVARFRTRRINFTFRFVPESHIVRFSDLPPESARDVQEYMEELARHSPFFAAELQRRG